jgi:hypothetical protein
MSVGLSRRELAAFLAAAPGLAQSPAARTPAEELRAATEQVRKNAQALAKIAVPIATEPAFQFKA